MLDLFRNDPDYKAIKNELESLTTEIMNITPKTSPQYQQFKRNMIEWSKKFDKAVEIGGKVSSVQKLQLVTKEPKLISIIKMFRYLALVESVGTTLIDLIILLLTACGKTFHIEQTHELPRVVHASSLRDLQSPNVTLAAKLGFLERNGLRATSRLIDRKLRNDIAHLNFNINGDGKISIKNKNINIDQKLNRFNKIFMFITVVLSESSLGKFWQEQQERKT